MSKKAQQVVFECGADEMRPLPYHLDLFRRLFKPGRRYTLIEHKERSRETHDHFFKLVHGYWYHWPESYVRPLENEDQLRKHALIRTGHYIQSVMAHGSREEAKAYVRDFMRYVDYAEGAISSTTTVMRIAKSQRKNVMDAAEFQKSKQDVLDFCQAVTGISPEQMLSEVKRGGAAAA